MAQDDRGEGEGGIKVTDRRRFTDSGEPAEAAGEPKPDEAQSSPPPEEGPVVAPGALPPVDFATFVLSLATSAQVHLGAVPNPSTGKQERDLSAARQTIDILGILEEKTKGNLSGDEGRLLQYVLHDLRLMYVEANKE